MGVIWTPPREAPDTRRGDVSQAASAPHGAAIMALRDATR